jgi:glycosyltransferase involved in cell wall biosynthesis
LYEIVIVNNNSTDRTKSICLKFIDDQPDLNCHYIEETNQGLSYARNRGIDEASGRFITFLDDDSVPHPEFLKVTREYLEKHTECMAVGGKIHLEFVEGKPAWINRYLSPLLGYFNLGDKTKPFSRGSYPRGSNMSFRKEIFAAIGDFNIELGRKGLSLSGGEEKELFSRIYRNNMQVMYLPHAEVNHLVPQDRTTTSFVKQQARGIGESEKIRTLHAGTLSYMGRILEECLKWVISMGLFIYYLVTFQSKKGKMILCFRYFVTIGLFT